MITKWKVSNFKSIYEETELNLGPLTIFAGANSSGKSTFIQSILLVAQTLAHKVGSRSVVLNGALTSFGQFDDLKSNGSKLDQINIKCTCRPLPDQDVPLPRQSPFTPRRATYYWARSNQLQEIACELSFDADPSSPQRELFQIQPRLFATQLSCVFGYEDNVEQKANISIHHSNEARSEIERAGTLNEIDGQLRSNLAYKVDLDENSMDEMKERYRSAQPAGCMLRHFLPERIICRIDAIQEDADAITSALQDVGRRAVGVRFQGREVFLPKEVIDVLREILKDTIDLDSVIKEQDPQESLSGETISFKTLLGGLRKLSDDKRREVRQRLREREDLSEHIYRAMRASSALTSETHAFVRLRPPPLIAEATRYLDDFFASSFKYLGPLRDAPKPLYPLAPAADPYDVGLRGEHTASILELHKNKRVKYIPSANFKSSIIDGKTITRPLETAVIDWLQYLGVASSVRSRDRGKLGHELKVGLSHSDSTHDLTHVGVGVSQVLPILVMCLLADTDSTLVFEQPELHLHPKVQTLLGDFFLSTALCDKQCIVETHSEYFIDRLRFRIAAASAEDELGNQTKIYFVEKPSQESSFHEVVINEYGAISDWPKGFFDQSQEQAEEIVRAAAMKRKASRRKNDA